MVFPEPLGPRRASHSPGRKRRSTPFRAKGPTIPLASSPPTAPPHEVEEEGPPEEGGDHAHGKLGGPGQGAGEEVGQGEERPAPQGAGREEEAVVLPQEAAEEAPANKLVLKVEGRSWLRVTRDGERLYEGIPEVGSELVFDLPVEVRSGNPGAVRVILGGKDLGPMGEPGIPVTRRYP